MNWKMVISERMILQRYRQIYKISIQKKIAIMKRAIMIICQKKMGTAQIIWMLNQMVMNTITLMR